MDALPSSLTGREPALVRETEPERLDALDGDALTELHLRVRRARDRQVKIYRRQAAALVPDVGGRGTARPKSTRNRKGLPKRHASERATVARRQARRDAR